jgi:hypothetical protein
MSKETNMTTSANQRLEAILQEIDLPERAYQLAQNRYVDIGNWLGREDSSLAPYQPHVFVQGSFALGTPIRPIVDGEEYDLDFTCRLKSGVTRISHTQQQLKELLRIELAAYREARQIKKELEEKNRCWRLGYQDELRFHMDVVPGIPADELRRRELSEAMAQNGLETAVAEQAARRAIWITDIEDPNYALLSRIWPSSNPGGYLLWFRTRMMSLQKRLLAEAQVDPVPVYRSKNSLQRVVQLLKRHRDVMFMDQPDSKPASIILTTIAGRAYVEGESLAQSMLRVLDELERVRASDTDEILNPVNPKENFADRWFREDCAEFLLKQNFHLWVQQANRDFRSMLDDETTHLVEIVEDRLKVKVSDDLCRALGLASTVSVSSPRIIQTASAPPKPWAQ